MPRVPASFRDILIDAAIRENQPGSADAIFPRELEESGIFTFAGRPGGVDWVKGRMQANLNVSTAGVSFVNGTIVPAASLTYYHAIAASHDDPSARQMVIELVEDGLAIGLASISSITDLEYLIVPRPIVLGETARIDARVASIAAGRSVTLRTYSITKGLGSELPGI